jgi:hypothetical protein
MEITALELDTLWQTMGAWLAFDPARLLEPEMMMRLALQCLLLIGSAFFSSSETALFSLSRLELRELRRSHHPKADILHDLLDQPRRLIISILCGKEVAAVVTQLNQRPRKTLGFKTPAVLMQNYMAAKAA